MREHVPSKRIMLVRVLCQEAMVVVWPRIVHASLRPLRHPSGTVFLSGVILLSSEPDAVFDLQH
jgi:hypothetical protein